MNTASLVPKRYAIQEDTNIKRTLRCVTKESKGSGADESIQHEGVCKEVRAVGCQDDRANISLGNRNKRVVSRRAGHTADTLWTRHVRPCQTLQHQLQLSSNTSGELGEG